MKNLIIAILSSFLLFSCTSSNNLSISELSDIQIKIAPDIQIYTTKEFIEITLLLSELSSGENKSSFIDSVKSVVFYAMDENRILDSSKINFVQKKKSYFKDNKLLYNLFESYKYRVDSSLSQNLNFRIEVLTNSNKFVKIIRPDLSIYTFLNSNKILSLYPSYQVNNDFIEFKLKARRIKPAEDSEYLPNSENFRLIITDLNGKSLYRSNFQMNYFQVIGKVKPINVDDTYEYSLIWNKMDNYNNKVSPGKYKAILTIPAIPNNYTEIITFEWK